MQKGRVLSLRRFGIAEFLGKNIFLITILIFLIVGIILGIFLFNDFEKLISYCDEYVSNYIGSRTGVSFLKILLNCYLENILVLFLFFVLGASLFGVITVPLAITIKGFLRGAVTAYIYSQFALKGIAFNAIIFIPSSIVFFVVLLLASRESIKFSIKITSLTVPKTLPLNLAFDFKNYGIKYSLYLFLSLISAFIDAVLSVGLMKYFSL